MIVMQEQTNHKSNKGLIAFFIIIVLWVVSIILSFFVESDPATLSRYNLTERDLTLVRIGLGIPMLFIWGVVLWGTQSFMRYARRIKDSVDGAGFKNIALGILFVLLGMIASSYITNIGNLIKESAMDPDRVKETLGLISRYSSILFALISYGFFFAGSRKLLGSISSKLSLKQFMPYLIGFLIASIAFAVLVFQNSYRSVSVDPLITAPYHGLSDPLILLTIVIPTIISWFLGLMALSGISAFRKNTPGVIYKDVLKNFHFGISLVIIMSIALSWVGQFSAYWASVGFGFILFIIGIIFVVWILGYLIAGIGARKLNRIEMVVGGSSESIAT